MLGRTQLSANYVLPTRVSSDGRPKLKAGGITILWSSVTAVSGDTTLPDGSIIKDGQKYLRYGQVMTKVGVAEVQTYTWTGGPTAGSAILTLPAEGDFAAESTSALAFDATGAQVQTALQALSRIGPNNVAVARTGAGSSGDPYVYTATYSSNIGNVPTLTAAHTFTGGTTPTATVATTTSGGTSAGYFAPFDSGASDGSQTLARGNCYILDRTVLQYETGAAGLSGANDVVGDCIEGGDVWIERVLQSGTATQSKTLGPTLANLLTAFPSINLTRMT